MSELTGTPRKWKHVRVFLVSLLVLLLGLAVFVFGVSMESMSSAKGWVTADGLLEVRAERAGLIDLGHLEVGSTIKGGTHLAKLRPATWWQEGSALSAPTTTPLWLLVAVHVAPGQAVEAGQRICTLIPLDAATGQPRLLARLEVSEEHIVEVQVGQSVRVSSNLYNDRVHGKFTARVTHIGQLAEVGRDGKRYFGVMASLEASDRPLLLGSGLKAEIVLGRKRVYRIILEH